MPVRLSQSVLPPHAVTAYLSATGLVSLLAVWSKLAPKR
jgi:hypothetical protein